MSQGSAPISLAQALRAARDTRALEIGSQILDKTPQIFREQFGSRPAIIVADTNTFQAAGRVVADAFHRERHFCPEPFIFSDPALYAEFEYVLQLEDFLNTHDAIPVAVGSGTINDLVKLTAHRLQRPYLCAATAASMDGY